MTVRLLQSSFLNHQQDMKEKKFVAGIYPDEVHKDHEVEVTEEGIIFCGKVNGWKLLCNYPYIGEICEDCPLKK